MTPPTVTVSMPTYRSGATLRRAVESVLNQTHQELRLVVVNDGDPRFPQRSLPKDPRLTVLNLRVNRGRYYADAVTLAACDTEWWTAHDADDWSEPDRYARMLSAGRHHDVVWSGYVTHRLNGTSRVRYPKPQFMTGRNRRVLRHVAHHTALYRTDALKSIGGPHPGYRVGYDTLMVAVAANRLTWTTIRTQSAMYHYEHQRQSLTHARETGMGSVYRRRVHEARNEAWQRFLADGDLPVNGELRDDVDSDAAQLRALL